MSSLPFPIAEIGSIEKTIIIGLATAGGFLVGFVLTNLIGRALCKFVFHRTASERLLRFARFGGGVAGAILTYLLLSGEGGFGLGGGSGGKGVALKQDDGTNEPKNKEPKVDPKIDPKLNDKKNATQAETVTIYVLPTNAAGEIRYRWENEEPILAIEQVLQIIDDRNKDGKPIKLVRIDFLREKGKLAPNSPAGGRKLLQTRLDERKIETILPPID